MGIQNTLKAKVKQVLTDRCVRDYERTYCHALKEAEYREAIVAAENFQLACWQAKGVLKELPAAQLVKYSFDKKIDFSALADTMSCEETGPLTNGGVVVFADDRVALSEHALWVLQYWMSVHPQVLCAYGDEDVNDKEGGRRTPWLKPDWSPDLFCSMYYLGGIFCVRKELFFTVCAEYAGKEILPVEYFAKLLFCAGGFEKRTDRIGHIPFTLCHHQSAEDYNSYMCAWATENVNAEGISAGREISENTNNKITSVIIPTKDHPDVLERNLRSLVKTTLGVPLEIVIVDNGSTDENKKKIEKLIRDLTWHDIKYIYEPMEFHFSKMCNIGAKNAKGEYLLFLNDDTEALEEGWLEKMRDKAARPYAGAVGAKLLYPDSDKIQHAGIVNLPMGPVHKLQFRSDKENYYFNRNHVVVNVLAVTAACLMVKAERFHEAGGFAEDLPVAFNDVDFCFSLYEKGYYNVVRNDVSLFHHESLSRGDDEAPEKLKRLERERAKLYERHPALLKKDPFYHVYLNREGLDTRIVPAPHETLSCESNDVQVKEIPALPPLAETENGKMRLYKGLYVRVESVGGNFCQGYSFMSGDDNACYEKKLLFENREDGRCYTVLPERKLRQDLQDNMPDQKNVAMSGFAVNVYGLPVGNYTIGVMAKNKVTGVTYVNRCARTLCIGEKYELEK